MAKFITLPRLKASALALAGVLLAGVASADTGFYIGASAGGATIESDFDTTTVPELPSSIDEDDTAYKIFGGFKFDLPVLDLGIEGGYVNFGEPEVQITGVPGISEIGFETTGLNVWGTAGIEVGPLDVFGKLGMISWDIEAGIDGFDSVEDDGTDLAYGLGVSFDIGSLQLRGEYEIYDFDDADYEMLSVGIALRF